MPEKYEALVARLQQVNDIGSAMAVMSLDQETAMPPKGVEARARQMSTLTRLQHEMLTDDKTARLLEDAGGEIAGMPDDSDETRMLQVAQYEYDKATKLPADLLADISHTQSIAQQKWVAARQAKDFSIFQESLEKMLDLTRQSAEYLGHDGVPYDALLDQYERGMTTAQVKTIFDNHKPALVELIAAIADAQQVDNSALQQNFDVEKQKRFAKEIVSHFGFDFERGNTHVVTHPFATSFSVNDVRITNRYDANFLNTALFGMMHEAGHGMYEQGVAQRFDGTVLGSGTSLGVHESQSRLWENLVGRSRGFWAWAYPKLQNYFPNQLAHVEMETFYKAINRVQPSFIRVEADEATYNLHIMLRFELEIGMVDGSVAVKDLPDLWNTRFQEYFGITPPDDGQGVLQDVHWSVGLIGYFATYALGNMLSVQYYKQALQDQPSIPDEITEGKFDTLLTWLNENIHQHGRKFTGVELTERLTGGSIQADDYMGYLREKYTDIYDL